LNKSAPDRIKDILTDLYNNDTEKAGRPNYEPVLVVKTLLLILL